MSREMSVPASWEVPARVVVMVVGGAAGDGVDIVAGLDAVVGRDVDEGVPAVGAGAGGDPVPADEVAAAVEIGIVARASAWSSAAASGASAAAGPAGGSVTSTTMGSVEVGLGAACDVGTTSEGPSTLRSSQTAAPMVARTSAVVRIDRLPPAPSVRRIARPVMGD